VSKFEFIWHVMNINSGMAFLLVKKSQLKPIFLDVILRRGLVYGMLVVSNGGSKQLLKE
jgi:hypothetical protein